MKNEEAVVEFLDSDHEKTPVSRLDLDKTWHGIHYLLSGKSWGGDGPAAMAVLGGTSIGGDAGYGPARYLTAAEVEIVADSLAVITREMLGSRYVPSQLEEAQIYPSGIWEDEGDEAFEYLMQRYVRLVDFYKSAANNKSAMLLFIS